MSRILNNMKEDDEPDWIVEHARKQKRQAVLQQRTDLETRLRKIRERENTIRKRFEKGEPAQKKLVGYLNGSKEEKFLGLTVAETG